jgi:uncharacterized membrane protein YeiH
MEQAFDLPNIIDYTATLLWAISGALVGARRGYDLSGITAVALVSSTGGGLLRDGLFLQEGPPALVQSPTYLLLILIAALGVGQFGHRVVRYRSFESMISLLDGIGIGAYAIVGLQLARSDGLDLSAAILVGIVNAVGGGVLRDLLVHREPDIFRPGIPTALAALFGCLVFLTLRRLLDLPVGISAWIAIAAVFLMRYLALRHNFRTRSIIGFSPGDD